MNGQLSTSVKSPRILGAVAMAKANLYNPNVLTMVGFTLMALALMFMPSTHAEAVDLFTKGRTNIKDTCLDPVYHRRSGRSIHLHQNQKPGCFWWYRSSYGFR